MTGKTYSTICDCLTSPPEPADLLGPDWFPWADAWEATRWEHEMSCPVARSLTGCPPAAEPEPECPPIDEDALEGPEAYDARRRYLG